MEIVELAPHLGEDIGDQVFKDSAFVAIEVALQDVKLRSVLQHADEQAGVAHIDLKGILFRVPIQRQLGNGQIVAPCDDASILDPLQASGIFCGGGAFFYNGILEFLVFLGKLAGNGLETLLDAGLILFLRVLYHVVLIGTNDVPLDTQDLIHLPAGHKGLDSIRHSSHNGILEQKLPHPVVQRFRHRGTGVQRTLQQRNDRFGDIIGP